MKANNNKFKKHIIAFAVCLFFFNGFIHADAKKEFTKANFISEGEFAHQALKFEVENTSSDNLKLVSVNIQNIMDKLEYLTIDARGSVLGGGVITKNVTKIVLKDFPSGAYSFKVIGKDFVELNKFVI